MINSGWRRALGEDISSINFLMDSIHNSVIALINKYKQDLQINKDVERAQTLQNYLYQIKNCLANSQTESNIFTANERNLLIDKLTSLGIEDISKIFNISGGTTFEENLVKLNLALIQIFSEEPLDIKLKFQQISTGSKLNTSKIIKGLNDATAEALKLKTKKIIENEKKQKRQFYFVQSTQIKADFITQGVEVKQNIQAPHLEEFLNLYANASFSAKNYSTLKRKRAYSLGSTSVVRILADFLPIIDSRFSNISLLTSFLIALTTRSKKNASEKKEIETHLDHIRLIYQLQGVGQSIRDKDLTTIELQAYVNQGVDFLIINDYSGKNIQVKSTKDLLVRSLIEEGNDLNNLFKLRTVKGKRVVQIRA